MIGELTHRPKTLSCNDLACESASVERGGVASNQVGQLPMWRLRSQTLDWSQPYVMGILNLTPDSFSDGGRVKGEIGRAHV